MALGCRHGLDAGAHNIVEHVLRGEAPAARLTVSAERERGSFGLNSSAMSFAQSSRPARILAISMKKFMPIAQKKERRGAKLSTSMPAFTPARTYSIPSASV